MPQITPHLENSPVVFKSPLCVGHLWKLDHLSLRVRPYFFVELFWPMEDGTSQVSLCHKRLDLNHGSVLCLGLASRVHSLLGVSKRVLLDLLNFLSKLEFLRRRQHLANDFTLYLSS